MPETASVRRQSQLAKEAWQLVGQAAATAHKRELRTRLMGLPPMLQAAGLPATMAFLEGKAGAALGDQPQNADALERAYAAVHRAIVDRVNSELAQQIDPQGFIVWLGNCDLAAFRRATREARALADWLRRAAEAIIPPP